MKRTNKKVWLTAFLATAFTLFGAGVATMNSVDVSANNVVTAESVGLVMDKGAGVRLGTSDGNNGIRFVLTMDKTEYNALMEKVGTDEGDVYSDISFGMIITKASYVTDAKDLTVENLFGEKAVFEWKPAGADENWTVSEGKTLVVNQTFGYLGTAEDYDNDFVGFASLVQLHDYNLTQEFIGRGYMKYTEKDGSVNYRMADYYENVRANNVRSMAYVAQKALEDPKMAENVETLKSLYINHSAVQAKTVNVTVNHHKVDVHGEETIETETLTGQKIGETATATALTDAEWIYDEEKSTASGVVYANDKTVLDLYYDQDPEVTYDLWYKESDANNTSPATGYLAKNYNFTTPLKAMKGDKFTLTFLMDVIDYNRIDSSTGEACKEEIQMYIGFYDSTNFNADTLVGQKTWFKGVFPAVGESEELSFEISTPWQAICQVDYVNIIIKAMGSKFSIGIDDITISRVEEVNNDYDAFFKSYKSGNTSAITVKLENPIQGGEKNGTFKVTLNVNVMQGTISKLLFRLKYSEGTTVQALNGDTWHTVTATGTYEFTGTFGNWGYTNPTDIYTVEILLQTPTNTPYCKVGVKIVDIAVNV